MMPRPGAIAQSLKDAAWLNAGPLVALLGVLDRDGEEARAVGGAVRNALMGLPVAEIDVATTAVPEEVVRRVRAAGFKPVPTGIEHGTITVVIDKAPFEVTTLRQDVETYGRHAKVAFGRDWKTDAERRDFTINALSAARDGTVYDYVGGLDDLKARRVRFIGDANRRIEEDYLRILRFFRFHAAYASGHPDAEGLAACIAGRDGLEQLSRERVRMEMLKLLAAPRATPTLAAMAECGLLLRVLGGVPYLAAFENMAKVEAAIGSAPDAVQRLGALGVMVAEDAARLWQKLRLTNAEHERLALDGRRLAAHLAGSERASGARAALPARPGGIHRSRAARLGALARRCARRRLEGACDIAGALDRAGISAESGRLHQARARTGRRLAKRCARRKRPGSRRGFRGGAGALEKIADAVPR